MKSADRILNASEIDRKVRRMAYEIYEANVKEKDLVIAGIAGEGYRLAEMLAKEIGDISPAKTILLEIDVDKEKPHLSDIELKGGEKEVAGKSVIVVDDVLNTGRTLIYSLRPFLDMKVKKIYVAVLVNRGHNKFPVKADFVGLALSTTLNDHISVTLNRKKEVLLQ